MEDVEVVADAAAIAQRLIGDGEKPNGEAVGRSCLGNSKASFDALNASNYVADRDTRLRTDDPQKLPDAAQETRMQAIIRIATNAAKRVGRVVRWRPERIRVPEKPSQAPTQAPAPAQTPASPKTQRLVPAAEVRMPEVPVTERLARVYAAKVSRGEMGFTDAVNALVSADRREAERTLDYHWNPVHQIATPKGGRRPANPEVWTDRLERRISLYEQGSTDALWPELAKVKQQAEAQARIQSTAPTKVSKARTEATSSRTATGTANPLPPNGKGMGREKGPRMER